MMSVVSITASVVLITGGHIVSVFSTLQTRKKWYLPTARVGEKDGGRRKGKGMMVSKKMPCLCFKGSGIF